MHNQNVLKEAALGAAAGAAATIPMSWAMEIMHQVLPLKERDPLPPRKIADRLERVTGVEHQLSEEQRVWIALAAHVAYGAAAGSLYAATVRQAPGQPMLKGTLYGLGVWAGSYLGLLPALGLMSPATKHRARRNALMITAHVVWGSALGIFADLMEPQREREHLEFLGAGNDADVKRTGRGELGGRVVEARRSSYGEAIRLPGARRF